MGVLTFTPTGSLKTITIPDKTGEVSLLGQTIANDELVNSNITITAGDGLDSGGSVSLGSSIALKVGAGTGITVGSDSISTSLGTSISGSELDADTIDFSHIADSLTLDATTTVSAGANNFIINLDSTGDFIVQDNGTAFATFADDGSVTFANGLTVSGDITLSGNDLIFGNSERIVNTTDGTIGFTDGTNTLASIIDQGSYGTLRLVDKGSTGDPSTCSAGDLYFNSTDATVKACTATNTWEGLDGGGLGYTLQMTTDSGGNPLDSTTYYLGLGSSITLETTANNANTRLYIPKAGTVTAAYGIFTVAGTLGSSETSTLAVRLNDTTPTTITSSLTLNSVSSNTFSKSDLSIAVAAGDYLSFTLATPAFVTNPTLIRFSVSVYIQ